MVTLSYSFFDSFTLLFKVSYFFVVFMGGWLGYEMARASIHNGRP